MKSSHQQYGENRWLFDGDGITLGFDSKKEIYDAAGNALEAAAPSSVERYVMDNTAPAGDKVITWDTIAVDDNINMFEDDASHTTVGAEVKHDDARVGDKVTIVISDGASFTKTYSDIAALEDVGGKLKFT